MGYFTYVFDVGCDALGLIYFTERLVFVWGLYLCRHTFVFVCFTRVICLFIGYRSSLVYDCFCLLDCITEGWFGMLFCELFVVGLFFEFCGLIFYVVFVVLFCMLF